MSRTASNGERRVKYTFVECNNKVIHRGYSLQDDIHGHYAQQETIACTYARFHNRKVSFSFWRSVVNLHFPGMPLAKGSFSRNLMLQ